MKFVSELRLGIAKFFLQDIILEPDSNILCFVGHTVSDTTVTQFCSSRMRTAIENPNKWAMMSSNKAFFMGTEIWFYIIFMSQNTVILVS